MATLQAKINKKITVIGITGDRYNFEDISSCSFNQETEMFEIRADDGTVMFVPREAVFLVGSVEEADPMEDDLIFDEEEKGEGEILDIFDYQKRED